MGLATVVGGDHVQAAHDGGAHHRRARSHQHRVAYDAGDHHRCGPPTAQQAPGDGPEEPRQDGDVEAGNGDHVGRVGARKGLYHVLGDAVFHPQQDAREQ